jgi:hypothetical protein
MSRRTSGFLSEINEPWESFESCKILLGVPGFID